MKKEPMHLDHEENELLAEIERGKWVSKPLSAQERKEYQYSVSESKPLKPKKKAESLKG